MKMSLRKSASLTAAALGAAWLIADRLGRTSGSTAAERSAVLPGDDLVPRPQIVTDHSSSIGALPQDVWPWLLQMGWHRGGWYTHRWVDRLLFPDNLASAEQILPEWQDLQVGDQIPDGRPEAQCYFVVRTLEKERLMVLQSTSHLPPGLAGKPGVALNWTWTFELQPEGYHCTRFHFRSRITLAPWWLRWGYRLLLVPADHIMAGSMCRGIKRRAEARAAVREMVADEA